MASIKLKFRPSKNTSGEGTIYYQIIHERQILQLASGYKVFATEWNHKRSTISACNDVRRGETLLSIHDQINRDLERFFKIVRRFSRQGLPYTADDIVREFRRYINDYTLLNYMQSIIVKLRMNGRIRTSEAYLSALNSFRNFLDTHRVYVDNRLCNDIMLDSLTSEVMESFEAWHRGRGIVPNTISFYIRIIRAVYNRAVESEIIDDRNPFRHVYTGVDKTVKRALPLKAIKQLKLLNLAVGSTLDYARDMFLASFYFRGMSFIDMAYLKKTDLKNGYISYRRRKTGQMLIIKWTKDMQTILDKYPENESEYLLPIIRHNNGNERNSYRNASYNINRNLKIIAQMSDISIPLTLYVARHSWASAAKAKGIPVNVISEGMGHDSEATTQIYLSGLDASVVDKANSIILDSLN